MVLVFQKNTAPPWNQSPAPNPACFSFTLCKMEVIIPPNFLSFARLQPLNGREVCHSNKQNINFSRCPTMWSHSPSKLWFRVSLKLTPKWKSASSCLKMLIYGHLRYFSFARNLQVALPQTVLMPSWIGNGKWDATSKHISDDGRVLQSGKWIWPGSSDTKGGKKCLPDSMANPLWVFHVHCKFENSLTMKVIKLNLDATVVFKSRRKQDLSFVVCALHISVVKQDVVDLRDKKS